MIDANALKDGDRVQFSMASVRGAAATRWRARVDQVTEHYVALNWGFRPLTTRCDIVLKTSPLWQLLELVE